MGLFSRKNKGDKKAKTELIATLNIKARIKPSTRDRIMRNF